MYKFSPELENPQMNPGAWGILVAIATVVTRCLRRATPTQSTVNAL